MGLPVGAFLLWLDPHVESYTLYAIVTVVACGAVAVAAWSRWPGFFELERASLAPLFTLSVFILTVFPLPFIVPLLTDWVWETWIATVGAAFIFSVLGIVFVRLAAPPLEASKQPHRSGEGELVVAIGLLVLCFAATAYWMRSVGDFAVFAAVRGGTDAAELLDLRENAHKLLEGPLVRVVAYLRGLVFPFTTTMLLVVALTRRTAILWALFAMAFAANFFVTIVSLEKLYAVMLLLQMLFAWLLFTSRRIRYAVLFAAVIAVFLIYLLITYLTKNPDDVNFGYNIYSGIVWRVAAVPAALVGSYIDYFTYNDFMMGRSLPIVSKLFSDGLWIENEICRQYWGGGETCNANAGYMAYLWGDFGWFGVTIGAFIAGAVLAAIQNYSLDMPPTATSAAARSTMAVHVLTVSMSAFGGFATWALVTILFAAGVRMLVRFVAAPSIARASVKLKTV